MAKLRDSYIKLLNQIDLREGYSEKEHGSGSDPGGCFAAGLLAVLLVVGGSVVYHIHEDKFPEKNVPLSKELRPYDLNKDGRLDPSELEKFQRDYELKKR